jgi:seryl-tRNA synthetase
MANVADRSASDSEINELGLEKTPTGYLFPRYKRKREDDYSLELKDFKADMKSMILTQEKEFRKMLAEIQHSNNNIQSSVELLISQNDEYKKKIISLENQHKEDKKYITVLEDKIEEMQVSSRKSNIEIKNVPKKYNETKEDLMEMVTSLSSTIGSSLKKTDIKDIYRVKTKRDGARSAPIGVETSSTILKSEILKLSKTFNIKHKNKLRALHLGFKTAEDTPIFVSEHLTSKGSRLHFLARDLSKSKNYKFCWTAYGKVHVRKDESTPIITIRSEAQVQNLMQGI